MELPKASWLQINPERAEEMLKAIESNRRLISAHVSFLASEMIGGRWKINGDTIRFSGKRLLDGQHRLHAVIQSGIPIWALVVEELDQDSFATIDTGRVRGAGDILSLYGIGSNPFMVAAAARFIYYHDRKMNLDSSMRVSNQEIVDTVRKNPVISFVADHINTGKTMRTSSIVAALVFIARKAGREITITFADKLRTGANLGLNDPIRFFRDKWMSESSHRSSRGDRAVWIAVCIKTFNAWAEHKRCERIERWAAGEKFPEAVKPAIELMTTVAARDRTG